MKSREAQGVSSTQGYFGDWGSRRKEDGSEVTEIDLAVEDLVRDELARRMPEDGIYGEEKGSTDGVSRRRWIIDPVNGTTSFTRR
ncbi:inositol monophosphatase family protein [Streptomyces sp. cg28]|uniref:inositol monophosphatase family protein n=1 Tax=Streptomyces sp. cg28 TaxID=3403457 RepID=UPI003B21F6EE